jgi:prevent-host-death family protein
MESATVRRLSHDMAGVLVQVAAVATVEITKNGRPIARIVPIAPDRLGETGRAWGSSPAADRSAVTLGQRAVHLEPDGTPAAGAAAVGVGAHQFDERVVRGGVEPEPQ